MRKIKLLLWSLALAGSTIPAQAQAIRKSFREMGPAERTDYNDALQQFYNGGARTSTFAPPTSSAFISDYPIMHWEAGNAYNGDVHSIHMSLYFLPFHRTFLLDWENRLRSFSNTVTGQSYNYLAAPYWDWTEDAGSSTASITSSSLPSFWAYSFIPAANFSTWHFNYVSGLYFPGTPRSVTFSRPTTFGSPAVINSVAGPTAVNNVLSNSAFYNYGSMSGGFSASLEHGPHDNIHGYIGGTMGAFYSPLDPVFWMHHGMVDKVWDDWEEAHTTTYGSIDLMNLPFTTTWMGMPSTFFPANLPVYTTEACATKVDDRYLQFKGNMYDVWYAYKGTVLLNGNKGTTFAVTSGATKTYRYTVYNTGTSQYDQGEMYVGDVRRSGTSVVTDTKGGFKVNNGGTCHFRAAKVIDFKPGFSADAGSTVTAKIINTPNGF